MQTEPRDLKQPTTPATRRNSTDSVLAFFMGNYLAVLQFSYFFLLDAYISSRAYAFFIALFFWLTGFLAGLNINRPRLLPVFLLISGAAYYLAFSLVRLFPFELPLLPLAGICIVFSGMLPGYYFFSVQQRFSQVKTLFFHENNGFIIGILATLCGAVFAGKWLLTLGPATGLLPVCLLWFRQSSGGTGNTLTPITPAPFSRSKTMAPASGTCYPFFITGMHLGILQVSIYFTVLCFVTATFMGYFAVTLAWLGGIIINMRWRITRSLTSALVVSMIAYFLLLKLTIAFPLNHFYLPAIAVLGVLIALPAGAFFRDYSKTVSGFSLFLHENNGFIVGYLISLLGFVQWGVNFLYLAPLLSFLGALSCRVKNIFHLFCIPAMAGFCFVTGNNAAGAILSGAAFLALVSRLTTARPPAVIPLTEPMPLTKNSFSSSHRNRLILLFSGCNLILLQYFITREFSLILAATEVTILIVSTAYFCGFSVGYWISSRLPPYLLTLSAIVTFVLHLSLFLAIKLLAGLLIQAGHGAGVLVALLFCTVFCTSAFYSILLPKIIAEQGNSTLASAYSWDLAGGAAGVIILLVLAQSFPRLPGALYFLLLLVLCVLVINDRRLKCSFLILGGFALGLYIAHLETIQRYSSEDYYRTRGYDNPAIIYQGNSLYHTIEVLDSFRDAEQKIPHSRASFLNGVRYFSYRFDDQGGFRTETGLSEFTYFLAGLPANYLAAGLGRRLRILILGGGSMHSLSRVSTFSAMTTLVEIDPLVVDSAKRCWSELNRYDELDNYEIVIDDARHYLNSTDEKFDLIIVDISAPYYLGTNILHTRDFFTLVRDHLAPQGLLAESTQGRPRPERPDGQGMKILKAIEEVYPTYRIIDCRGPVRSNRGYVLAGVDHDFSTDRLRAIMRTDGYDSGTAVFSENSSVFDFSQTIPYSMNNMETLLSGNLWRLKSRLRRDNSSDQPFLSHWGEYKLPGAIMRRIRTPWFAGAFILAIIAAALPWLPMRRDKSAGTEPKTRD